MGLGWDAATGGFMGMGGGNIDLDASCGMFDANKTMIDAVSFRQLHSRDGSIRHSGDNLTGAGDGDDEVINVALADVPTNVQSIVFTINSYQGQTFEKVKNCFCRLVDSVNNQEICVYKLADSGPHTGMIMAKVYRHNGGWKMAALGVPCNGRTITDIAAEMAAVL